MHDTKNRRSFPAAIRALWQHVGRRRRVQFFGILGIMVLASATEVISLGMFVPFLAILVDPANASAVPLLTVVLPDLGSTQLVIWLGLAFCLAILVSAAVRLLMLYATTKFTFMLGADLSYEVYRRALLQPYSVHISRNSADVINGVTAKANQVATSVVGQLLTIASSMLLCASVLAALAVVDVAITSAAIAGFVAIYGTILWFTRGAVSKHSQTVAREGALAYKALQEGLGGIRDIIIDATQETFVDAYRNADRRLRAAQAGILYSAGSPRYLVESIGMSLIVLIAILAASSGANASVIATLGALGLGAQRLLPVVQQAYAAITTVRGAGDMLYDVVDILGQPVLMTDSVGEVSFSEDIVLDGVGFFYPDTDAPILNNVSVRIPVGSRVGIFGETGGGKSTLLDILMGLLHPVEGAMLVDGVSITARNAKAWHRHVAHVPQSIFLTDASVAENVAFGRPPDQIDMQRVQEAAKVAQLEDVVEKLPNKYDTLVGERGSRLSGGQRQRVGIARAIYKRANLVILDEATSALDGRTEADLIEAIEGLGDGLTIVMVAHRMSTLRHCDILLEVRAGRVRSVAHDEVFGTRR